jgi:Cu(I)/Ag(I) efflux system membrane protein CusA/SilA
MPIKTRVDMLSTGIRTPIGIKVFGTQLEQIEKIGMVLEHLLTPIEGTRSVLYERALGGLYLDIVPDRLALARYGLRIGDVERVIEAAIGGAPVTSTVEGRNRFTINVRYPQDLRSDLERLRNVLVPTRTGMGAAGNEGGALMNMGKQGSRFLGPARGTAEEPAEPAIMLAQNMGGMASGSRPSPLMPLAPLAGPETMSDVSPMSLPRQASMGQGMGGSGGAPMPAGGPGGVATTPSIKQAFIPLGQLAEIKIVNGPPMVRDEDGLLVGYVYVDIDQAKRDIGGYVDEAKRVVLAAQAAGTLSMPPGYLLKWTGQYEQLEEMAARMKIVLPMTLMIVVLLLFLHFRNIVETLIVLLSIPFALVGSVWALWLLDYRLSTAVWVGVIALVGLATQTGIVMIVYIDNAFERRKRAGKIRNLNDIIWAHMEGTVQRVRPKLMTVATMLAGLIPLLWATGSGADVMKRIAAPMVGGLITSAFLTLEIIPVIYTYWRQEQLLWEKLEALDGPLLVRLKVAAYGLAVCGAVMVFGAAALFYVEAGAVLPLGAASFGVTAFVGVGCGLGYVWQRPAAHRQVWPVGAT